MHFGEFQQLTHEIGTAILVALYLARLVILLRRRPAVDLASDAPHPRGLHAVELAPSAQQAAGDVRDPSGAGPAHRINRHTAAPGDRR